jgi:polar amino acid transport system substrate-binding protein
MKANDSIRTAFAPIGHLRASINIGNPILASMDPATHKPLGVSVDLAMALGQRLGVEVELVVFDTAGKSVQAVANEQADIGFFAIDPVRGAQIAFTAAYVLIEGFYLVRNESPIHCNADVDTKQHRVTVGQSSAYDLFLSRELKHAQIVRAPSSPTVVQTFLEQELEVAAGVKQQLQQHAAATPGLRLLPERFMVISQAMGIPKSRGEEAALFLYDFVEEMKASGFVADALVRHRITGASIAPASD